MKDKLFDIFCELNQVYGAVADSCERVCDDASVSKATLGKLGKIVLRVKTIWEETTNENPS